MENIEKWREDRKRIVRKSHESRIKKLLVDKRMQWLKDPVNRSRTTYQLVAIDTQALRGDVENLEREIKEIEKTLYHSLIKRGICPQCDHEMVPIEGCFTCNECGWCAC